MGTTPEQPSGVRVTTAAAVLAVVGLASAGLWLWIGRGGRLVPVPPALAAVALVALTAIVLWFAWPVRRYLRTGGSHRIDPIRAARSVVLAQAGALTGAAAGGWYAGQAAAVAADLSLVANQNRLWRIALMVVLSLALAGGGLLAQRWCRIGPRPDDE